MLIVNITLSLKKKKSLEIVYGKYMQMKQKNEKRKVLCQWQRHSHSHCHSHCHYYRSQMERYLQRRVLKVWLTYTRVKWKIELKIKLVQYKRALDRLLTTFQSWVCYYQYHRELKVKYTMIVRARVRTIMDAWMKVMRKNIHLRLLSNTCTYKWWYCVHIFIV